MKKLIVAVLVLSAGAYAWLSLPAPPKWEQVAGGHADHAGDPNALTVGVVVAVDQAASSVTISHGPIPNLGMGGMTMGFKVDDPALLQAVKPGDKVKFHVDAVGGAFTVMRLEPAN